MSSVQHYLNTLCSSTKEQRAEYLRLMRAGMEVLQQRQAIEQMLGSLNGQQLKDRLFVLLGEPHRCGNKNTPYKYGSRNDQIRESVLTLEMAAIQKRICDNLELEQLFDPVPTVVRSREIAGEDLMRSGLEVLQQRQAIEQELASFNGQQLKDRLFILLGQPHRVGNKNTPSKYGSRNHQIRKSVLDLEMAAIQKRAYDTIGF